MARIRTVKPDYWEDEIIAELSVRARLLFIATWNFADDEGLLRWTADYVRASVFMYDDLSDEDTAAVMGELETAGLVVPYRGGRAHQRLAWIPTFLTHQRINRPQPSRLPPPCIQNVEIRSAYVERDKWLCHVCGGEINRIPQGGRDPLTRGHGDDSLNLSLDHVDPRCNGGNDYPSNIRAAHLRCNRSKNGSVNDARIDSLNHSWTEDDADWPDGVNDSPLERKGKEEEEERKRMSVVPWTPPAVVLDNGHLEAAVALCEHFANRLTARGHRADPKSKTWVIPMEAMLRLDGRTPDEIRRVIDWLDAGSDPISHFWKPNVLSPDKLRQRWPRMAEQYAGQRNKPSGRHAGVAGVTAQRIAEALFGAEAS